MVRLLFSADQVQCVYPCLLPWVAGFSGMYLTATGLPSRPPDRLTQPCDRPWQVGRWAGRAGQGTPRQAVAGGRRGPAPLCSALRRWHQEAAAAHSGGNFESSFPPVSSYSFPDCFLFRFSSSGLSKCKPPGGGVALSARRSHPVIGAGKWEIEKESEISPPPSKTPMLQQCTSCGHVDLLAEFCLKNQTSFPQLFCINPCQLKWGELERT